MTSKILRWFTYAHLKDPTLRATSRSFSLLAHKLADDLAPSAELSTSLRKLLEAKDAAVRATIYDRDPDPDERPQPPGEAQGPAEFDPMAHPFPAKKSGPRRLGSIGVFKDFDDMDENKRKAAIVGGATDDD